MKFHPDTLRPPPTRSRYFRLAGGGNLGTPLLEHPQNLAGPCAMAHKIRSDPAAAATTTRHRPCYDAFCIKKSLVAAPAVAIAEAVSQAR